MKKYSWLIVALPLALAACNNEAGDSVDKADSANEAKADIQDTANNGATVIAADEESAEFMVAAADGGMMEVELGRAAKEKATHPRVKAFGDMMAMDHGKANEELKALAARKNVTLPAALSENNQKHVTDMSKKSAKEFDKDYMGMMVDDHKDDIDKFEKASKNSKDAEVKAFAEKTLPTLRAHLDSAKAIKDALDKRN
ncbi:MAG: DUF4142 domain-containing protein [Gemmatimonadaceae bacterium]|nr:DUF4142 domain-containing protein [Chitinophagaceae bacterium]